SRDGRGGTAPGRVAEQLDELRATVAQARSWAGQPVTQTGETR
ncbi:MAG: hypothetical protein QOG96_6492, partial [Pseudonocardiales bacterium]|nr:hypothetical protein [Pseudonocardiales bacterium]